MGLRGDEYTLSLTGPRSHTFHSEPGVGAVAIGPPGSAISGIPHLVVDPDDKLDWTAFDGLTTPSGNHWPRVFTYHGNDPSFLTWSHTRRIESFAWLPTSDVLADTEGAQVTRLRIEARTGKVQLRLPAPTAAREMMLSLVGNLPSFELEGLAGSSLEVDLRPDQGSRSNPPLKLPTFASLAAVLDVSVGAHPNRQPVDVASLAQFPNVQRLSLSGRLEGLETLSRFALSSLALSDCPDAAALPPLESWPHLTTFDAWNIDEATGQRLRAEAKKLVLPRQPHRKVSITQLRKPDWFLSDYGLPFADWPARQSRAATKAYRQAFAAIRAGEDAQGAVRGFVRALNGFPDLDTIERDDAGDAVALLAEVAQIDADTAMEWFDEERDF